MMVKTAILDQFQYDYQMNYLILFRFSHANEGEHMVANNQTINWLDPLRHVPVKPKVCFKISSQS